VNDDEIIAAIRAGNRRAANLLARRYHDELNAYYRKRLPLEIADELTQVTLLETIAKIDRFRGESSFHHYVFSVARRVMSDHYRRIGRRIEIDPTPRSEPAGVQTSPSERFARAEYLAELHAAIDELDEHYQSVMTLHMRGASNHEIADELDIRYNTVRSRLSRAYAAVRARLAPLLDELLSVTMPREAEEPSPSC